MPQHSSSNLQQSDQLDYYLEQGIPSYFEENCDESDDCLQKYINFLGKNGIEKIIELDLNEEEKSMLEESAEAVRNVMAVLDNMNAEA